jgi:DNA-binding NarL/FixJ family response regulator
VKVLVVDDHEIVRRGLSAFLRSMTDVDEVVEAGSGAEALALLRANQGNDLPDIVLLDVHMPRASGLATARTISEEFPALPFVFLTGHKEAEAVRGAVALGASGFIFKDASTDDIETAIRTAVRGGAYFDADAAAALRAPALADDPFRTLTPRESEVLRLVAEGLSNRDIGLALNLSERTARTHVSALLGKLGVSSRTQAAILVMRFDADAEEGFDALT